MSPRVALFGEPVVESLSPRMQNAAFAAAGGDARIALVTLLAGIDAAAARTRLEQAHGSVRAALQ